MPPVARFGTTLLTGYRRDRVTEDDLEGEQKRHRQQHRVYQGHGGPGRTDEQPPGEHRGLRQQMSPAGRGSADGSAVQNRHQDLRR